MPNRSIHASCAALVFCCSLGVPAATWADSFTVQVQVADASGQPIDDASVSLVGLYRHSSIPHATPGAIRLAHQGNGRYNATLEEHAEPLRHHFREALLVVSSPGHQLYALKLPQTRVRSNLPLDVTLAPSAEQSLRVVDSQGQPLQGVVLKPAVWHHNLLPWFDELPEATPTTADGVTTANWIDDANLAMVYASGEAIGNQRLPVSVADDRVLEVTVLPTFESPGRWSAPLDMQQHESFFDSPVTALASDRTISIFSGTDQNEATYCWATRMPRPDGTFAPFRLFAGELLVQGDLPPSIPLVTRFKRESLEPGGPIVLYWADGIRVRGKLVDDRSGEPLPGVAIYSFSMSHKQSTTAADGSFQLWFHPEGTIQYFPADATGKHTMADAIYLSPETRPVDGVLDLEPIGMIATSTATGTVVDSQGDPVAGARIECRYQVESTTDSVLLFSDADGRFQFRGMMPENIAVTLSAMTESMMTAEPYSIQLAPQATVELRLAPRHAIRARGRVIDADGKPVPGAAVTIRTPQVHDQENYGGESATAVPLLLLGAAIVTDSHGHFLSPPIVDWQRRLSLAIRAPGYRALQTYWTDAEPLGRAETNWDAGELQLLPQWPSVTETLEIVDARNGQPLIGARAVCRGVYIQPQRHYTDRQGRVTFQLPDSTAVIAVAQQGYHSEFLVRQPGEPLQRVELRPLDAPPPVHKPAELDRKQRVQLAANLMQRVTKPTSTDSLHRLATYYRAAAFADFETTLADIAALQATSEEGQQIAELVAYTDGLNGDQLKAAEQLLGRKDLDLLLRQADYTESHDQKLELYGEAMLLVEQMAGDMALAARGYLAQKLYEAGEDESAAQLLQDALNNHEKLKRILENQERQETRVSRNFLSFYAVVDPKVSLELIRLTAPANGVLQLQTLAIRCAVEYGGHDPESLCREFGIEYLSAQGMTSGSPPIKHRSMERGLALAQRCPDEPGKASFLFELAKHSDADDQSKILLAQTAFDIIRFAQDGGGSIDPGHWLAERLGLVCSWDADLGQQYAFEALWLPPKHTRITPHHDIATLARHLARFDAAVARALIEPCFDDWSWLFDQRDSYVMFVSNPPLHTAAAIDADWTVDLIDDLFARHLPEHESRRLEVVSGVIGSLAD